MTQAAEFDPETFRGAQGFFRVARDVDGRWWFVDPEVRPFIYRGVTSVNRAGRAGGRLAPDGPYRAAVDEKFGPEGSPAFRDDVFRRLRGWGFNALGAWATEEFFDAGFPYTEILECVKLGPPIKIPGLVNVPDVFDPDWEAAVDVQARRLCLPRRDSKDLIGYFTDNELGWAQPKAEDIAVQVRLGTSSKLPKPALLQICLSGSEDLPAAKAAWDFVRQRHPDPAKLAERWALPQVTAEALRRLTDAKKAVATPGFFDDNADFSRLFSERYYAITARAIRKYDPNHLILGSRFGAPPGEAILEACVYPNVDVLSANNYQHTMRERIDLYHETGDMPVLIGEFAWASDYFTQIPFEGEPDGIDPKGRMLIKGRASLEEAFTHPAMVGYTWYRWVDQPDHCPPFNFGVVHIDDSTSTHHTSVLTTINARAESIASGRTKPLTHAELMILNHALSPAP